MAERKHHGYKTDFEKASMREPDQKRKFRMKRFDDEVIRNERMLWTKNTFAYLVISLYNVMPSAF